MSNNIFNSPIVKKPRVFTETDYVTYKEVERIKAGFDPKHPEDFLIEKSVVEDTRVPIDEDINSYRSKVGLKNLLKGIVSKRQMAEFIEKTQSTGQNIDLIKFPDSHLAVEELAGNIDKIWDKIPAELKGSLTKEEFISSITSKKLESYVMNEIAKMEAVSKTKTMEEGEK